MGDVQVGMLLSGGVDSAAVLGLMCEAGYTSLPTFTIGFADKLYDERPGARLVAERHRTDHHELLVDAKDFVDALPRLAWYRDEPMAEPTEAVLLLLAELAGRSVKVVLSGDGGDELFGGYPKYRAERVLGSGLVPSAALARAVQLMSRRPSHRGLLRAAESMRISDEVTRWASWFRSFGPAELDALLAPSLREAAAPERLTAPLRALLEPYAAVDRSRRQLIGDLLTYLPENMLVRSDKVLMAASVEGRMPLLDRRVVEQVAQAPARDRTGLRTGKALLRAAIADLVPQSTLRAPKRGFPVPMGRFLLEDSRRVVERLLLADRTADRGLFAPDALRALVLDAAPADGPPAQALHARVARALVPRQHRLDNRGPARQLRRAARRRTRARGCVKRQTAPRRGLCESRRELSRGSGPARRGRAYGRARGGVRRSAPVPKRACSHDRYRTNGIRSA